MAQGLYFIAGDGEAAEQLANSYRAQGWLAAAGACSEPDLLDKMLVSKPVAAIFSLAGDSAPTARLLASRIVAEPSIERPLVVFIGGDTHEIDAARHDVPYAVFVSAEELPWVLKHLSYKA